MGAEDENTRNDVRAGTKRKRSEPQDSGLQHKKQRRDDNEVRCLSANTMGLDKAKLANLNALADQEQIDVLFLQEVSGGSGQNLVDRRAWDVFETTERPSAAQLKLSLDGREHTAKPSVGTSRFYLTMVRKDSGITLFEEPYTPGTSKQVREYIHPAAAITTGGGNSGRPQRTSTRPVDMSKLSQLGLRGPQVLTLSKPGTQSVKVFNFHAPQGSGSANGYSGMDAKSGHEVLSRVVADDSTPLKLVTGDQNAHPGEMAKHYPKMTRQSVGPTDPLIHTVATPGLKLQKIDLGDSGRAFKNKGAAGCSDHEPQAFSLTLPDSI